MTLNHEKIQVYRQNPLLYANEQMGFVPDPWQYDYFSVLPSTAPEHQRIALKACVGPGKTAVEAITVCWFLSCFGDKGEHPKGAAVSVTADNLKDNLWPEISKWMQRSEFMKRKFVWTKERVFCREHPETWFFAARSWSKKADAEEQGRTLSGLHSKYVMALVDESGEIPLPVFKAAEQALSTGPTFGKIIQAGNPSSLDGALYAAATELAHLWHMITITGDPDDPKRSPRINIDWAREQIKTYGRDNPWVMYSILGLFPPSSINALLGPDEVQEAMNRHLRIDMYDWSQRRLGVDVARFGDDRTVIFPRQGLASFKPVVMRNARSNEIAARVLMAKKNWGSEREYVDGTGGFGSGVIDSLIQAGQSPAEIHFAGKASDPRYFNIRAEMYLELQKWVRRGGALPNLPELKKELTTMTYTLQNGKLRVEDKDQIKARLKFSPDIADALALTFAEADMPGTGTIEEVRAQRQRGSRIISEYDPQRREYDPDRR